MAKRVLALIVVLVVAICAYVGYNSYDAKRAGVTGDVFSNDPPGAKVKTGPATKGITVAVPSSRDKTSDSDGEAIVYPAQNAQAQEATTPSAAASGSQVTQTGGAPQGTAAGKIPNGDTISPDPPNGMVFSGAGKYQLYRQGNLTWRVNTETGQSCIIFATDDEWKKPRVARAGCGSR